MFMRNGKRTLSLVLSIALLLTVASSLAACGGRQTGKEKLVFMTIGYGDQADAKMVHEEFNKRIEQYIPGVEVEFIIVPASEFAEQFELKMISGAQVDVAWTGYAFSFTEQVEKGNYMQLDELIEKNAPELKQATLPWMLDLGSVGGKLYQIPRLEWMNEWRMALSTPTSLFSDHWDVDAAREVFQENGDAYRSMNAGMYDFLEDYLNKIKANDNIQSGISFRGMAFNYGAFVYDSASAPVMRLPRRGMPYDFTVYNYYALPEVKLYYQKVAEFYQNGLVPRDITDINPRDYENTRTDKSFVAWFDEYVDINNLPYEDAVVAEGDKPYVKISLESDYYISRIESVSGHVIPVTSKYPDKAIQLIELLNTPKGRDLFNLLTFGIEGVHYKKIDENRIETLDYIGYPDDESRYGLQKWSVGNVAENCYLTQSEPQDDYFDYMKEVLDLAIVSPLIGFKPDIRALKSINMAVQEAVNEYEGPLGQGILGDGWEQQYDLMLAKMQEAGVDDLLQGLQSQVDEYLSENGISKSDFIAE